MVWCSPERHGAMTAIMKAQIDWIPLSLGAVRPTQGKTLAIMQVCGGSQSFNALNQMRVLGRWMRLNAPLRREIDGGPAPDPADEIMLYQTLVSAWPLGLAADDREGVAAFGERVAAWQEKSLREAKRHSGWAAPNEAYEAACKDFLTQLLDPERASRGVFDLAAFAARIAPAGAVNGIAQTLLRLITPGVPDLYQGAEFWDLSLVDPDNRRPVDYPARAAALDAALSPIDLLPAWRDGRVKQAVIARALDYRRRAPGLFLSGSHQLLKVEGERADHIIASARIHEGRASVAIVTRFAARFLGPEDLPLISAEDWAGTAIILPRSLSSRGMTDVFGGPGHSGNSGRVAVADVLGGFPAALLEAR
jgi:(1->4)-alpha-D-glucan 1-alpha-D-glucosylmutase